MIKHIVLFKLASFAEGNSKQENAQYLKTKLEGLQDLIPELLKIEVFINSPKASPENFTNTRFITDVPLYIFAIISKRGLGGV